MSDEPDKNVRELLGKRVREVWIEWAKTQPDPKPSWLVPWEEMEEKDREVDRQIGETIARESTASKDVQIKLLSGSAKLAAETARRNAEEAATLSRDLERERNDRSAAPWMTLALLVATAALLVWTWSSIPEPVVCPPPPDPVICQTCHTAEAATDTPAPTPAPTTHSAADAYWITDANGNVHHRDWPDASGYPAERFIADCHNVCEVTTGYGADRGPGRVLSVDPEHLVCICLHRDSVWPVTRWIGWERQ